MANDLALRERVADRGSLIPRTLYVAWQNPATRTITPVGRLNVSQRDGDATFEFRYLVGARDTLARPFTGFPDFDARYQSTRLFPFFENRMVPVERADYGDWAASVGLSQESDPFEVLASNGGLRATDTLEVFAEPSVDRINATAALRFLVRGVRHIVGANERIDRLNVGDQLRLLPEPTNPEDRLAVLVLPESDEAIGWVPAYLCGVLHRSAEATAASWQGMTTTVIHIGDSAGPRHFRLLCDMVFPWPFEDRPFDTPQFAVNADPN